MLMPLKKSQFQTIVKSYPCRLLSKTVQRHAFNTPKNTKNTSYPHGVRFFSLALSLFPLHSNASCPRVPAFPLFIYMIIKTSDTTMANPDIFAHTASPLSGHASDKNIPSYLQMQYNDSDQFKITSKPK